MKPVRFSDAIDLSGEHDALVLARTAVCAQRLHSGSNPNQFMPIAEQTRIFIVDVIKGPEDLMGADLTLPGGHRSFQRQKNGLVVCWLTFEDGGWGFHRLNSRLAATHEAISL